MRTDNGDSAPQVVVSLIITRRTNEKSIPFGRNHCVHRCCHGWCHLGVPVLFPILHPLQFRKARSEMVRLCTFLDRGLWFKRDRTGHNKVGYISRSDVVVYPVRRHYVEIPLKQVVRQMRGKELQVLEKRCPGWCHENIDRFFTENVLNPSLMNLGPKQRFGVLPPSGRIVSLLISGVFLHRLHQNST